VSRGDGPLGALHNFSTSTVAHPSSKFLQLEFLFPRTQLQSISLATVKSQHYVTRQLSQIL